MLSARTSLLCVSILLLTLSAHRATAQSLLPQADGEKSRFSAVVEIPKGYLSGVCVMLVEGDCVKGSFFNDFGISFFDFAYSRTKDKVKLLSVQPMMERVPPMENGLKPAYCRPTIMQMASTIGLTPVVS